MQRKTYRVVPSGKSYRIQVTDLNRPAGWQVATIGAGSSKFLFPTAEAAQAEADKLAMATATACNCADHLGELDGTHAADCPATIDWQSGDRAIKSLGHN